ncbi:MAG: hypothetical protein ACK41P_02640 [Asticcacaulis sp.]
MAVSTPSDPTPRILSQTGLPQAVLPMAALTPPTREDAQRYMNIAVGVCSPFWLPFVAAAVGGASYWWMSNLGRRMMPQSADNFCASWEAVDSAPVAVDPEAHPPVPVPEMASFDVGLHMAEETAHAIEEVVSDAAELVGAGADLTPAVQPTSARPTARSSKSRKPA